MPAPGKISLCTAAPLLKKIGKELLSDFFEERGGCTQARQNELLSSSFHKLTYYIGHAGSAQVESDRDHLTAARAAHACFGNVWKTQGKMVRLIVITTVLSVFILLLYIPYVPSKDLNYNQGVETRRIIEQPSSTENNPALYALERLHFLS